MSEGPALPGATGLEALEQPFRIGSMTLANRWVMAPMTRYFSPQGVPSPDVAEYYRRRALGGVGLIITEGTWIAHPAASNDDNVPRFYGDEALQGWRRVVDAVHSVGGKIAPQLWHVGLTRRPAFRNLHATAPEDLSKKVGPSGYVLPGERVGEDMTSAQIDAVIDAYAQGARNAERLGFDGVEIHGAHGYLVDQFFWHETNRRTDRWGGDLPARGRFAVEMIRACRAQVSADFPIILRFSQWKLQNFVAKLATTPGELESLLVPLARAGVDAFHASQRRFWEPEFPDSPLSLAGWARRLTGKPAITVGSVGLEREMLETIASREGCRVAHLDRLAEMFARQEFDLVAVGRALLSDPQWADKVRRGAWHELQGLRSEALTTLT